MPILPVKNEREDTAFARPHVARVVVRGAVSDLGEPAGWRAARSPPRRGAARAAAP